MAFVEIHGIVGQGENVKTGDFNVTRQVNPFIRQNEAPHGLYATGIISKTYRQVIYPVMV